LKLVVLLITKVKQVLCPAVALTLRVGTGRKLKLLLLVLIVVQKESVITDSDLD